MAKFRESRGAARRKRLRRRPPAPHTPRREPKRAAAQAAFLRALAATGNIARAAAAAKVARERHSEWLARDPAYAERFAAAEATARDGLTAEARRRAVDGVDEPVVYQGKLCGAWLDAAGKPVAPGDPAAASFVPLTIKKYSDPLLMFLIKGECPEYRGRTDAQKTPPAGDTLIQFVFGQVESAARRDDARLHDEDGGSFDGRTLRLGGPGGEG